MSKRDNLILLEDIVEAIQKIKKYTAGLTHDEFLSDQKTQDAVVRNFEIMGEAVSRMNIEFHEANPQVNWRALKDFRNILIHAYEIIDYSLVWAVIQDDLPSAYESVRELLNDLIGDKS